MSAHGKYGMLCNGKMEERERGEGWGQTEADRPTNYTKRKKKSYAWDTEY